MVIDRLDKLRPIRIRRHPGDTLYLHPGLSKQFANGEHLRLRIDVVDIDLSSQSAVDELP